jgi:hypothetical protein
VGYKSGDVDLGVVGYITITLEGTETVLLTLQQDGANNTLWWFIAQRLMI